MPPTRIDEEFAPANQPMNAFNAVCKRLGRIVRPILANLIAGWRRSSKAMRFNGSGRHDDLADRP
jgi:hypothetical protein